MATVTRYIGKCPVCEGDFKLHQLKMVHHGYKRPGIGEIVGDCFGVGYPPYELSTEGTEAYLMAVESGLENNRRALHRFQHDQPTIREQTNRHRRYEKPQFEDLTSADGHRYKDALQRRVRETEHAIRELEREQRRCEALVANWHKRPVRTEEEDMRLKEQTSSASRAARDEARQQRQAKRDATVAKQQAREQRERLFAEHYRDAFLIPDLTAVRAVAIWIKMHREAKKQVSSGGRFLMSFVKDMGIDDRLIGLGLAKTRDRGRYADYADERGWLR